RHTSFSRDWSFRRVLFRSGEFAALHRLGPADLERARRWVRGGGWNWELVDLAQLGVAATPGTQVEMERVRRALLDEGPFTALSKIGRASCRGRVSATVVAV